MAEETFEAGFFLSDKDSVFYQDAQGLEYHPNALLDPEDAQEYGIPYVQCDQGIYYYQAQPIQGFSDDMEEDEMADPNGWYVPDHTESYLEEDVLAYEEEYEDRLQQSYEEEKKEEKCLGDYQEQDLRQQYLKQEQQAMSEEDVCTGCEHPEIAEISCNDTDTATVRSSVTLVQETPITPTPTRCKIISDEEPEKPKRKAERSKTRHSTGDMTEETTKHKTKTAKPRRAHSSGNILEDDKDHHSKDKRQATSDKDGGKTKHSSSHSSNRKGRSRTGSKSPMRTPEDSKHSRKSRSTRSRKKEEETVPPPPELKASVSQGHAHAKRTEKSPTRRSLPADTLQPYVGQCVLENKVIRRGAMSHNANEAEPSAKAGGRPTPSRSVSVSNFAQADLSSDSQDNKKSHKSSRKGSSRSASKRRHPSSSRKESSSKSDRSRSRSNDHEETSKPGSRSSVPRSGSSSNQRVPRSERGLPTRARSMRQIIKPFDDVNGPAAFQRQRSRSLSPDKTHNKATMVPTHEETKKEKDNRGRTSSGSKSILSDAKERKARNGSSSPPRSGSPVPRTARASRSRTLKEDLSPAFKRTLSRSLSPENFRSNELMVDCGYEPMDMEPRAAALESPKENIYKHGASVLTNLGTIEEKAPARKQQHAPRRPRARRATCTRLTLAARSNQRAMARQHHALAVDHYEHRKEEEGIQGQMERIRKLEETLASLKSQPPAAESANVHGTTATHGVGWAVPDALLRDGKTAIRTVKGAGKLAADASTATTDAIMQEGEMAINAALDVGKKAVNASIATTHLAADATVLVGKTAVHTAVGAAKGAASLGLTTTQVAAGATILAAKTAASTTAGVMKVAMNGTLALNAKRRKSFQFSLNPTANPSA